MKVTSAKPYPDTLTLEQAEYAWPIVAGQFSSFAAGYFRMPGFDIFDYGHEGLAVFLCHHNNSQIIVNGTKVTIKTKET